MTELLEGKLLIGTKGGKVREVHLIFRFYCGSFGEASTKIKRTHESLNGRENFDSIL